MRVQPILESGESIVLIRLAKPLPESHADFFTRYKVGLGKVDGSASIVTDRRCVVVNISSNSGTARVDPSTSCDGIGEVG